MPKTRQVIDQTNLFLSSTPITRSCLFAQVTVALQRGKYPVLWVGADTAVACSHVRLLSVDISSDLSLDYHVSRIYTGGVYRLRQFRRIRRSLDSDSFAILVYTLLITRLSSWFDIHGYVLIWFKSYLSSRSFCVKSDNNFSSFHTSSWGVPQDFVFGPLYSSSCTLPLSVLWSLLFPLIDHHFYADDPQFFFSFHPLKFDSSISHLQNALQQISSWTTANLLTLNSSKLEFLLIRLKNQLAKIHKFSLDASHSARNLGFIFDKHLIFSGQTTSLSNACYYHILQLHCIRLYLDSSTASTIATSIVHSKLDYCILSTINSLSLN